MGLFVAEQAFMPAAADANLSALAAEVKPATQRDCFPGIPLAQIKRSSKAPPGSAFTSVLPRRIPCLVSARAYENRGAVFPRPLPTFLLNLS